MVLRIPEGGLELESSVDTMATLPLQAFAVSLTEDVLDDLIESFRNGTGVELSLGQTPTFLYGDNTHQISRVPDTFSYDIYHTSSDSSKTVNLLANPAMPLFNPKNRPSYYEPPVVHVRKAPIEALEVVENPATHQKSQSKGNSLQPQGAKSTTAGKKTIVSAKSNVFSNQARSRNSSPALSIVGSPIPENPIETSMQQAVKNAQEVRAPVTHLLAVREMTYDELWEKWAGGEDTKKEFRNILDKVSDLDTSTGKYSMKKMYWKELDVWKHNYDSDSDRQHAIDNAVRQFDRMRIGASEPVWQKLLPFDERGKGKCLSKLQATLAKGPKGLPPKIQVQKAEDSSGGGSPDSRDADTRSINGSEPMSRSNSQTKTKKGVDSLPKKPAVSVPKKAGPPKVSVPKAASKSAAKPGAGANGRGPLSKEIITDSDESSEEIPLSKQTKAKEPAPAVRPPKPPTSSAPPLKNKPVNVAAREPIKPQNPVRPLMKRAREDDDSSSSSGTPLSKKPRPKEPVRVPKEPVRPKELVRPPKEIKQAKPVKAAPPPAEKPRLSGKTVTSSSRANVTNSTPTITKAKNKPSPLASSPPTNASDVDPAEEALIASVNKKRKLATDSYDESSSGDRKVSISKRSADDDVSSARRNSKLPPDVMDKARQFKAAYSNYERLHHQLANLARPEESKLNDLIEMRRKLEKMKRDIYAGTSYDTGSTSSSSCGGGISKDRRPAANDRHSAVNNSVRRRTGAYDERP